MAEIACEADSGISQYNGNSIGLFAMPALVRADTPSTKATSGNRSDAQTSGGLLIVGELPGHPVIGHTVPGRGIEVR